MSLRRISARTAIVATAVGVLATGLHASAATGPCSLSGTAFLDSNRNGALDDGETPRSGDVLYLYDSAGGYVSNVSTDSAGHYAYPSLACGSYALTYASNSWWNVRNNLVPTTTGSLFPRQTVTLAGAGTADFGWRPILRSTQAGSPLDVFTGPQGLRVESYDDVVGAKTLYDALLQGDVGPEAKDVTVRFDLTASSMTNTSVGATNGTYDSFNAISHVDYVSWLDGGDTTLVHEYGHAWSLYRAYLVQQDPAMTSYLKARGIYGDPRVGSSYAWATNELIAEDYRQLLGSPSASQAAQTNADLPRASTVPGLKEFLLGAFSTSAAAPAPSPSPTASSSPSPAPSPTVAPTPTASPTPTATPKRRGCTKKC
ncbi:MAG: hypothetical protein QOG99_807 [Frankiales bacterium]|nr:hypothetical protein [Frankiales bacterium]